MVTRQRRKGKIGRRAAGDFGAEFRQFAITADSPPPARPAKAVTVSD
jgi:hypothetical protein